MGRPDVVTPHGTEIAGCCVRLKGYVNGVQVCHLRPCQPCGTSCPASNAGIGRVGVSNKSKCSWNWDSFTPRFALCIVASRYDMRLYELPSAAISSRPGSILLRASVP